MSFKQIGEIIPQLITKNLQDPEQQRSLIKTVAGFVTRPDLSDADSGYTLGRLQEINAEAQRERDREAAQAKAFQEIQKQQREMIFKGGLADLKAARDAEQKELDRASAEKIAGAEREADLIKISRERLQSVESGKDISIAAHFVSVGGGLYEPTDHLMRLFKESKHKFANFTKRQLSKNAEFDAYRKNIVNNASLYASKMRGAGRGEQLSEEGISVIGGALPLAFFKTNNLSQMEVTLDTTSFQRAENPEQAVQMNSERYILNLVNGFRNLFSNPANKKPEITSIFNVDDKRWDRINSLYGQIGNDILDKKSFRSNENLKTLGSELVDIIEKKGEANFVRAAIMKSIAPQIVKDPKTAQVISQKAGSGITTTITDYSLLVQNPVAKSIAIEMKLVKPEEIPDISDTVATRSDSTKPKAKPVIVYAQFAAPNIANFISNISTQVADNSLVYTEFVKSRDKLRSEGFTRETLREESNRLYKLVERYNIKDISPYDLVTYLHLQSKKKSSTKHLTRSTYETETYEIRGLPRFDPKNNQMTKAFSDRLAKDNSLLDLRNHVQRLGLIKNMDVERFTQIVDVPKTAPTTGSVSELATTFESFTRFIREGARALGLRNPNDTNADYIQSRTSFLDYKNLLSSKNKKIMNRVEEEAFKSQKILEDKYNDKKNKTASDYNLFIKRTTLLWEKTALTYKLAGIVQGDQTGGRTISDQDFSTIYNSLWGGSFAPEIISEAALSNLYKTTAEALMKRQAEGILLEATGETFVDPSLESVITGITQQRMNDFYNDNGIKDALQQRSQAGSTYNKDESVRDFNSVYQFANFKGKINFTNSQIKDYVAIAEMFDDKETFQNDINILKNQNNIDLIKKYVNNDTGKDTQQFRSFLITLDYLIKQKDSIVNASNVTNELFERGVEDDFKNLYDRMRELKRQYIMFANDLNKISNDQDRTNLINSNPYSKLMMGSN